MFKSFILDTDSNIFWYKITVGSCGKKLHLFKITISSSSFWIFKFCLLFLFIIVNILHFISYKNDDVLIEIRVSGQSQKIRTLANNTNPLCNHYQHETKCSSIKIIVIWNLYQVKIMFDDQQKQKKIKVKIKEIKWRRNWWFLKFHPFLATPFILIKIKILKINSYCHSKNFVIILHLLEILH